MLLAWYLYKRNHLWLSALAFALACFAKETGCALLGAICFSKYFFERNKTWQEHIRDVKPFLLILCIYASMRFYTLGVLSDNQGLWDGVESPLFLLTLGRIFTEYI
ncbi:MAG: hypothetical protein NZM44_06120 [Candidatus Calescibacterium sp.]|nr:hypothetical protein [Candidatus Calescibacterium sp.]